MYARCGGKYLGLSEVCLSGQHLPAGSERNRVHPDIMVRDLKSNDHSTEWFNVLLQVANRPVLFPGWEFIVDKVAL